MENESQEMTQEQAESLLSEATGSESPAIEQTEAPPTDYSWTLKHVDKEIKLDWMKDREKIQKWAEMGYDAPNKIGKLSKELESWKTKENQFKEIDQKYGEIDGYVRQNPKFWDHVIQTYQQREQALQDQSNPIAQTVSQLQQKLEDALKYIDEDKQYKSTIQQQQEDGAYQQELDSIKKSYPKIDFHTADESGKSLEYKVLEHAQKMGIGKFTTAFRDFYHDELKKMYAEEGKELVSKQAQKNTKLGLLGVSEAPITKRSSDVKGKNYNDIERDIIEQYQLT